MKETTIKAWVARDSNNELYFYYYGKPVKCSAMWCETVCGTKINNDHFPQVRWEDEEPTEVELTIKIKE